MEKRELIEHYVFRIHLLSLYHLTKIGQEIGVAEHHALRQPRGAAGKWQNRQGLVRVHSERSINAVPPLQEGGKGNQSSRNYFIRFFRDRDSATAVGLLQHLPA